MTEPLLIRHQREVLNDLVQLSADRAAAEANVERDFKSRNEAAETEFDEASQEIVTRFAVEKETVEREYQESCQAIEERFEAEQAPCDQEFAEARQRITGQYGKGKDEGKTVFQEACWTLATIFEGNKNEAENQLKEVEGRVGAKIHRIHAIQQDATGLVADWNLLPPPPEGKPAGSLPAPGHTQRNLQECLGNAEDLFQQLQELVIPRLIKGWRFFMFLLLAWLAGLGLSLLLEQWYIGMAAITAGALLVGLAGKPLLAMIARKQVARVYQPLLQSCADAETSRVRALELAQTNFQNHLAECKVPHDTAVKKAHKKYRHERSRLKEDRNAELMQAQGEYREQKIAMKQRRDNDRRQVDDSHRRRLADNKERYENGMFQVHERYQKQLEERKSRYASDWSQLIGNWKDGLNRIHTTVSEVCIQSRRLFPSWNDPSWNTWTPAAEVPAVIRFGEYRVNMDQIPHGVPTDERVPNIGPPRFSLPAFLSFPQRCSLLIKASEEGRQQAVLALQAVMLRLLTALPPGKARFTIIDPVGLGQNFSAFMHLADFDETLVGTRILTELPHIEQRLLDLTEHMENVIQKYLRNQFQTIEEYNVQAGEVAEPFRFLVVANFPVHFSTEAARRLLSIASSGSRCGVYTLICVDTKQPLPQGFNLTDLEQHSVNLTWKDGRFVWKDNDFSKFPLQLDTPPDADFVTRILQVVGQRAKEAGRVEVPFDFIAPAMEQWWTSNSRLGIQVPLGRAGATKRQQLKLGQGTAHHVLIAGKTGSGKSTLLHALITNISLLYSPEEIELYLVDFKEGVEFKAYAIHELPHARLVAIESEREFGLSVLQRLDAELKQRGDRFRDLGVQDVGAYRLANGTALMPRILLVVDEFQLFFVEDDKIAQEAALLLDRLVRQGRAFGIHVLLGSQTLGGAYSLARSTLGQMAVRIALQCNESDAHLILSDDNPAARLLSRPGEAIYNDANGLVEGNDFFQVVWLNDEQKEGYLERIRALALQRNVVVPAQIVFEGNAPADVGKNHLLTNLLQAATWPATARAAQAWLGEALAIKDATSAVFRPQSGSNLLIVGQNDEAALGILCTALVSLVAQHGPAPASAFGTGATQGADADARYYLLDGAPADSPHFGFMNQLPETLPGKIRLASRIELAAVIAEIAEEVERRQKTHEAEVPPIYLIVYGLHRFRDLRKQDDDFSFSRRGEDKPSPSKQFAAIMREGPGVSVYTLIWCDTLNNVNRSLDRQGLREFEMRVLFQMSTADSSTLIDSPLAAKLGLHRALFYSEERGHPEKFRPYGLPSKAWLQSVKQHLQKKRVAEPAPTPTV